MITEEQKKRLIHRLDADLSFIGVPLRSVRSVSGRTIDLPAEVGKALEMGAETLAAELESDLRKRRQLIMEGEMTTEEAVGVVEDGIVIKKALEILRGGTESSQLEDVKRWLKFVEKIR